MDVTITLTLFPSGAEKDITVASGYTLADLVRDYRLEGQDIMRDYAAVAPDAYANTTLADGDEITASRPQKGNA